METNQADQKTSTFGKKPDDYLTAFYNLYNANSPEEKIALLKKTLGGTFNFYALGGEVTDAMKLACLEYEYLERMGIINLVLA